MWLLHEFLFKKWVFFNQNVHFSIPRSEYQTAAHIGGLSISQEVCGELYSRCELEITELRDLVRGRQWSAQ